MCFDARLAFFLAAFLTLGQPLIAIFVVCLISAPFWATIVVGIASAAPQRL